MIAYLPPAAQRSELSYTRLTSQKLTGRHDIMKLYYADQEVHTTSPSPVVVDLKKTTAYQIVVGGETSL